MADAGNTPVVTPERKRRQAAKGFARTYPVANGAIDVFVKGIQTQIILPVQPQPVRVGDELVVTDVRPAYAGSSVAAIEHVLVAGAPYKKGDCVLLGEDCVVMTRRGRRGLYGSKVAYGKCIQDIRQDDLWSFAEYSADLAPEFAARYAVTVKAVSAVRLSAITAKDIGRIGFKGENSAECMDRFNAWWDGKYSGKSGLARAEDPVVFLFKTSRAVRRLVRDGALAEYC